MTKKNKDDSINPDVREAFSPETTLRQQAELRLRGQDDSSPTHVGTSSLKELGKAIHELQVHQLELEMQNEELRRVQVELDRLRERYFDLYDLAPVGYVTLSEKGIILETNLAAAKLLAITRNELVRQSLSRFIHRDDQDIYYLHRKKLFETGAPQICELRMLKANAPPLWAHLTATAATEENKPVCRIVISDITELKEETARRERLQLQLNQAQKMESVGRLAGGVAHDFNNMLSVIIGHTELIMDEIGKDNPLHNDLKEIEKAATRSADLTRQLLAFARKEAVIPKVLDVNHTVESMLKMLRRMIGEDIELIWLPGSRIYPVKVDPSQIDHILANLLVNARDAIKGVGKITIKTQTVDVEPYAVTRPGLSPGEYVLISVADDGCGMDTDTLEKVFEPFFTTKEMGKGTGLGLSMVYGAVKQNMGYIEVTSKPDQGTCFCIYLPRHAPAAFPETGMLFMETLGTCQGILLVVEDEPVILKLTTRILQKKGYTVVGASTPDQALDLAEKHKDAIQLLITDVVMPEMNGRDLANKLTALYPALKCLFMSGYTADVIARQGVLDEGVHFIQKPFTTKDLTDKVQQVLRA